MSESKKCQAKNPVTCRYHGVNHMTGFIFNKLVKKEGHVGAAADYLKLITDMDALLADTGKRHSYIDDNRDVEGLVQAINVHYFNENEKDRNHNLAYVLPVNRVAALMMWMRDKNATTLPKRNLLDPALTGTDGITRYDASMAKYMAKEGIPMSTGAGFSVGLITR
jgi:hypothetical protein